MTRKLTLGLLLGLSTLFGYSQQHSPLGNYLRAVGHPWDLGASLGTGGRDQKTYNIQSSILKLGLTGLRVYNDVDKSKDDQNYAYSLSPERRGFTTDDYIASLKAKNAALQIMYCYQGAPANVQTPWNTAGLKNTAYREYGADPSLSSTWTALAHDCAVLTLRGGRNKVGQDYPLVIGNWWDPPQVMYKGAGFYNIIEDGNEEDNQWSNTYPMSGAQYAVQWAVVWDSVKKVDPTMLLSTTGLCNADPQTLNDAWAWVNLNRGGRFPADIIQIHLYPWGWSLGLSGGLPGELSMVNEAIKMVAAAKGVPVDVGEWSWDIHRDSPINAPAHDGYTAEITRGQVAIRMLVKFSQIGIHGAYWYRLNQDYFTGDPLGGNFANDNNGVQFATSALRRQVDDNCNFVLTTAGDYFRQVKQFENYSWVSAQRDDTVQVHTLSNGVSTTQALWTVEKIIPWTDYKGVSHPEWVERKYNYYLPAGTVYRFNNDSSGVMLTERHSAGQITLTSSPIFFVADQVTLPVRLLKFEAYRSGQQSLLEWAADETAFSHYEVERSFNARDWQSIGYVLGGKTTYQYYDPHPQQGVNYYRLRMVSGDGTYAYSETKLVKFTSDKTRDITYSLLGQQLRPGQPLSAGIYLILSYDMNGTLVGKQYVRK